MGQVSVREDDEEPPVLLNTPTYVPVTEFMLTQHENERDTLRLLQRTTMMWSLAAMFAACLAFVSFVYGVQRNNVVPITNVNYVLVGIGLLGVALASVTANWIKSNEKTRDLLWKNSERLRRAQERTKCYAFFHDTDKQWRGYQQSVADVDHWCKMNRIPAKVALYEDPMFGEFGIYISFEDWGDPEANEENLIFFRLKFL